MCWVAARVAESPDQTRGRKILAFVGGGGGSRWRLQIFVVKITRVVFLLQMIVILCLNVITGVSYEKFHILFSNEKTFYVLSSAQS